MKGLVTGFSGLIGSALIESLSANGHEAIRLPRGKLAGRTPYWNPEHGVLELADAAGVDAVVHLAGDNLAVDRWTERRKASILDSRISGTRLLARRGCH